MSASRSHKQLSSGTASEKKPRKLETTSIVQLRLHRIRPFTA